MKKKLLTLAFVAASIFSFSTLAQQPATTCQGKKQCDAPVANCEKAKCDRPAGPCAFEGLTLTDAQRDQLKDLRAKNEQKMRDARNKKDEDRRKMREDRIAAKKQYLQDVKAIVGPEQYVIFLENFYMNNQGGPQRHKGNIARADHGRKHMKGDKARKGCIRTTPAQQAQAAQ